MTLVALLVGLGLPTANGVFLVRLLEGRTPVLSRGERLTVGFAFGITGTMYVTFLLSIAGILRIALPGFLVGQFLPLALLAGLAWQRRRSWIVPSSPSAPHSPPFSRRTTIALGIIGTFIAVKLAAGMFLLTALPAYFDDTLTNWNLRGKVYLEKERIVTVMEVGNEEVSAGGVLSYPPTVPLEKAFLASLRGEWSEGLVNAPHMLWYLAGAAFVFFALRRARGTRAALLGAYLLFSMPLPLIHGSSAYADAFLAMHVAAAGLLLFAGVTAGSRDERMSFLRLSAVAVGLLPFTKNEALLLHLPPLLLIAGVSLLFLWRKCALGARDCLGMIAWYGGAIAVVGIPWIAFKVAHGLTFGNAKGIPAFSLSWQPNVLYSIFYNTLFEANWIFFFPLLAALAVARFHQAFRTPIVILLAFFLIVYLGQFPIYLFTGLSTEVVRQTGYARGIVHLMPIVVTAATILLTDLLREKGIIGGREVVSREVVK